MSKVFAQRLSGRDGSGIAGGELAEYGLGTYAVFIAYSESVMGFLLFTLLLRTLGAVMLVPMLVNMIAVTSAFTGAVHPYVLGFFFLMNLALLYLDRALRTASGQALPGRASDPHAAPAALVRRPGAVLHQRPSLLRFGRLGLCTRHGWYRTGLPGVLPASTFVAEGAG
ncbi:MAG: hypothetical protein IPF41_11450 [Flavobacteriales bacterium]|nr:hypothetical protein [Flavobacteriales bacterium]